MKASALATRFIIAINSTLGATAAAGERGIYSPAITGLAIIAAASSCIAGITWL